MNQNNSLKTKDSKEKRLTMNIGTPTKLNVRKSVYRDIRIYTMRIQRKLKTPSMHYLTNGESRITTIISGTCKLSAHSLIQILLGGLCRSGTERYFQL